MRSVVCRERSEDGIQMGTGCQRTVGGLEWKVGDSIRTHAERGDGSVSRLSVLRTLW
jgi:hypothetical protein